MSRLPDRVDVLIVGSGFGGSLLARGLVEMGLEVLVVDRGRHPRFALGESTTPLGNLALERLALRFGWRDVWDLASWGRWQEHHADLRGGLKRGFSFFSASSGAGAADGAEQPVLVAASPNDRVADVQWFRADVDAELCRRAREAGAIVLEEWEVRDLDLGGPVRARLRPVGSGESVGHGIRADFLVDGSGAGRLLEGRVGGSRPAPLDTALLYGHLQGLPRIDAPHGAPYPPSWSAVHHLLDIGWMYELRFDDDLTSCGIVLDRKRCRDRGVALPGPGEDAGLSSFEDHLAGAPKLLERLEATESVGPLRWLERVGWRVEPVAGDHWARLPHSVGFIDPMFSTGIAWTLLGVERLLDVLAPDCPEAVRGRRLRLYSELVDREFDHLAGLLEGAQATWSDVDALGWYSMVYFAAASFTETCQRLDVQRHPGGPEVDPTSVDDLGWRGHPPWAWRGFLGADDPEVRAAVREARRVALDQGGLGRVETLRRHVPHWIQKFNVAGLGRPDRHPWYPVDLDPLREDCDRLGLTLPQVEGGLPRLLGELSYDELRSALPVPAGTS